MAETLPRLLSFVLLHDGIDHFDELALLRGRTAPDLLEDALLTHWGPVASPGDAARALLRPRRVAGISASRCSLSSVTQPAGSQTSS